MPDDLEPTYNRLFVDEGTADSTEVVPAASLSDDLSDVTVHYQEKSSGSTSEFTLVNVSNGPKTVLAMHGAGDSINTTAGSSDRMGPVTVDGTSNSDYPSAESYNADNQGGTLAVNIPGFAIRYDSSFKVEWEHGGTGRTVEVAAFVLGSGPHNAAIVQDGSRVYSVHRNLSDADINALSAPSGYKVVKNPGISHPDPMVRGSWDDANTQVVDHPYWKDFHDHLDNIRALGRHHGRDQVLSNVGGVIGTPPVTLPDPANGTVPPDPTDTSNIDADAMALCDDLWTDERPSQV